MIFLILSLVNYVEPTEGRAEGVAVQFTVDTNRKLPSGKYFEKVFGGEEGFRISTEKGEDYIDIVCHKGRSGSKNYINFESGRYAGFFKSFTTGITTTDQCSEAIRKIKNSFSKSGPTRISFENGPVKFNISADSANGGCLSRSAPEPSSDDDRAEQNSPDAK